MKMEYPTQTGAWLFMLEIPLRRALCVKPLSTVGGTIPTRASTYLRTGIAAW